MAEGDVAAMAREITRVVARPGWQSDRSVVPDMQKVLTKLTTLKVDVDLLQRTKIGAMVSKLKKHEDELVRGYSTTLTKQWKKQVGVADESKPSKSQERRQSAPSPSPTKTAGVDTARLESARQRLKQSYASEKATRDSRTVQVINRPMAKGRRSGAIISAAPSRSSIRGIQQARASSASRTVTLRTVSALPARSSSATRRVTPPMRKEPPPRRIPPPPTNGRPLTRDEIHEHRLRKLKALNERSGGRDIVDDRKSADRGTKADRAGASESRRPAPRGSSDRPSSGSRSNGGAPRELPSTDDARRAMLNKMFPRVCGVANPPAASSSSKTSAKKASPNAAASNRATKRGKAVNYSESQREVIEWLRGLSVDMSEYAPSFFENGFDSIKLLSTIEKQDLPGLVPKKGHHRLIQQALDDLRRKHSTSAASRQRPQERRKEHRRRPSDPFDEDSDDSFVVSDGDEYAPGVISAMFRKGRKRRYSIDSTDSMNMEASFDEIQHEEERSARIGEYEDYKEDMRNKKLLKKKKA